MPVSHAPKPIVTSWDVFDTLVARFLPNPLAALSIVQNELGCDDFFERRQAAQRSLDRRGAPYVLREIYRQMVEQGFPAADADLAMGAELDAERRLLFPIARNVARVEPSDLILSDMYMPPESIASILFDICDLHMHRPIIRSNWGKHTGTIWPHILRHYVIRCHVGDNPSSDIAVPNRFGITTELVKDSEATAWEQAISAAGQQQLALIQREVRLRKTPSGAGAFHAAVVGPYLTILAVVASHLLTRFGSATDFVFLSRSSDELLRVFSGLFPVVSARALDVSRRLSGDESLASTLAGFIQPNSLIVDVVGTGRSFLRFAEANGCVGQGLFLLVFLKLILGEGDQEVAQRRERAGTLRYLLKLSGGNFRIFEHLLQAHYPPVGSVTYDAQSGGIVRTYAGTELNQEETALVAWKSGVVTEFVRVARSRGFDAAEFANAVPLVAKGLEAIISDPQIIAPFRSFEARERMDWA